MNILICIPSLLIGGTEIQTLSLVQALIKNRHRVTTVCYFEYNSEMVKQYIQAGSKVVCLANNGQRLRGTACISMIYSGLRKIVKEDKPDIVHVQYMAPGAIPIFVLRILGIKKIIATVHTTADIYSNLTLIHFIQQHCVRVFTCISQRAEESFFGSSKLYETDTPLKRRNHFTVSNALPPYIHIRSEKRSFKDKALTLGIVSRLEKIKGMDLVIPAFAKVKAKYPNAQLLIVGDGSLRELMKQQANQLKVSEAITWAGRQASERLQVYYDSIDILLMPSRSEGFGLTAIEGMARGCIVVATNVGGLPEIVKDGEVGLLHQPESIEDMEDKIDQLIKNQSQLQTLSDNAIKAVEKYSFERYAILFSSLYQRI